MVKKMLGKLRHRGPDAHEVFEDDGIVLGARELTRNGTTGSRPIAESDGVALAADACIFNRDWLHERFVGPVAGPFTDQELLVEMYNQIGTEMFGYLDGAYVIAIADDGTSVLARDRYGLKPLYLSGGIRKGSFSSEIKSQELAEEEYVPFPPGKYMVRNKGMFPIRQRKTINYPACSVKRQAKALRERIVQGVEGAGQGSDRFNLLLSGGIDSSVIAAATSLVTDDMKTVCVGMEGGIDIDMARAVAGNLGTDHKEFLYDTDQMLELLDDVVYAAESFDFPLIRSCIPNYMASHMFDDSSRITLCGEGGDEIFAGYDYMRDIKGDDALRRERMKLLRTGWSTGFQRVDRMNASASLDGRMPLMAKPVIDLGLSVGRRSLIGPKLEQSKMLLRKSFEDLLPKNVMTRRKQRFSDGAGSLKALVDISEDIISDSEFQRAKRKLPKGRLRTKEELLYYRSFAKHFTSESALKAVGITPRP